MNYDEANQKLMLQTAYQAIEYGLQSQHMISVELTDYPVLLQKLGASFVTLLHEKQLRGCIGSLEANAPLIKDIALNAHLAAFQDPRFKPLSKREFPQLQLEISVLSEPYPFLVTDEQDLLAQLRPHIDGLILIEENRRSTFLPSVWEQLPDPRTFVQRLKNKAGLPSDYWSDNLQFMRYTTEKIT